MSKELDTSWFDLKNYDGLKTMAIEDWMLVIQTRTLIYEEYDHYANQRAFEREEDPEWKQECIQKMVNHLKYKCLSLIDGFHYFTVTDYLEEESSNSSFSTPSVDSLSVTQSWDISEDGTLGGDIHLGSIYQKNRDKHAIQTIMLGILKDGIGECIRVQDAAYEERTHESICELNEATDEQVKVLKEYKNEYHGDENYDNFIREAHRTPYDFRHKQYFNQDYISSLAHVTIDLNAPDEQIKNDFTHWLTHYRKASGLHIPKKKAHKKLFTQATFDHWIKFGLIPYIDLKLMADIEGKEITQEKLGELIFPDEFVDTDYRIRTITKPEAERLMEEATHWSLLMQAANEKATKAKIA